MLRGLRCPNSRAQEPDRNDRSQRQLTVVFIQLSLFGRGARPRPNYSTCRRPCSMRPLKCATSYRLGTVRPSSAEVGSAQKLRLDHKAP